MLLVLAALDVTVLGARIDTFRLTPTTGTAGETWLVVGSDSRSELPAGADQSSFGSTTEVAGARADIVLLVHRALDGTVSTLSVPRDLLMHNQSGQLNRLALTYQVSPQNMVDSLCATLGVPVDHMVVVDFDVFTAVINTLEGVRVDLPKPIRDSFSGLNLPAAGPQNLSGDQALALVRSRHPEQLIDGRWVATADGAAQRTSWGGVIFRSLAARAASVRNPVLLQRLAWTVTGLTRTDSDLSPAGLAELAQMVGPVTDLPAEPLSGGLAVTTSDQTFTALAAAGLDRNCH